MSDAGQTSVSTLDKYDFLLRRLHSLTGMVPIGVFLCVHLTINASILDSGAVFQQRVDQLHSLGAFLIPVEIAFIFLPILFHALLGLKIVLSGQPNPAQYSYAASWRYALQRWTGVIAMVFIIGHLWHMHWLGRPFGGAFFDPHQAAPTVIAAMQGNPLWTPIYILGVLASVYHFANGIWTFLITWGLTIGPNAQRKAGYACAVAGVALSVLGVVTVIKLQTAGAAGVTTPTHARSAVNMERALALDQAHLGE